MGSFNKIVSGVFWSVFTNVVNAIYGFFAIPFLIAYFGKTEFGLITLATSINVYMQLMDMGLNSTNVRFFSLWLSEDNKTKIQDLFQTNLAIYLIIGFINATVLTILAFLSSTIFNLEANQVEVFQRLLIILSVTSIISWMSGAFEQLVRGMENVDWVQKVVLFQKLTVIIILVLTILLKLDIITYFLLTSSSIVICIPLYLKKIKNALPYLRFTPKVDKTILKDILPYGLSIFSFSLFQFTFFNLRPVFLGIQGTMDSVADYRVMDGICTLSTLVGSVFMGVLLPSATRVVAQKDKESYYRVAYDGTKYLTIIMAYVSFLLISASKDILTVYVGKEYLYLIPWLCLWLFSTLGYHNSCISSLILAGSDVRAIAYMSSFSSVVGLSLSWLLIPSLGVGGVVVAYFIYVIMQALFYYLYYWRVKMSINSWQVFRKSFLPFVIIGFLSSGICCLIPSTNNSWVNLFVIAFIFTGIYGSLICFVSTQEEKEMAISTIKKIIKI